MTNFDEIEVGSVLGRAPAVAWVEIDGEAVLYHEHANTVHVLNRPATIVWACLDGHSQLVDLSRDLAKAFGVEPQKMLNDVRATVTEFGRQGLLRDVEGDPIVQDQYVLPTVETEPQTDA